MNIFIAGYCWIQTTLVHKSKLIFPSSFSNNNYSVDFVHISGRGSEKARLELRNKRTKQEKKKCVKQINIYAVTTVTRWKLSVLHPTPSSSLRPLKRLNTGPHALSNTLLLPAIMNLSFSKWGISPSLVQLLVFIHLIQNLTDTTDGY